MHQTKLYSIFAYSLTLMFLTFLSCGEEKEEAKDGDGQEEIAQAEPIEDEEEIELISEPEHEEQIEEDFTPEKFEPDEIEEIETPEDALNDSSQDLEITSEDYNMEDADRTDLVLDSFEDETGYRACTPRAGNPAKVILRGTILTPEIALPDGEVFFHGDSAETDANHIVCVDYDCQSLPEASDATVICTNGIITPGLIDSHNHIHYNTLPLWRHEGRWFDDRYKWQATTSYHKFKDAYNDIVDSELCHMVKYAESRIAIGGATSVQGCRGARCIKPLVRNLEWSIETAGVGEEKIWTRVGSIDSMSSSSVATLIAELDSDTTEAFIPHLAEGINESSRAEFDTLESYGLMREETAIIHGTGGGAIEFAKMAAVGAKLIWSPNSNIDLYGMTTRVTIAHKLGVNISLAPDWTPSHGFSMIEELKCADFLNQNYFDREFSDEELVKMVTINPAIAMDLDEKIGRLQPGYYADITVFYGDRDNPYRAVISANTTDVAMVIRDGKLLYGDPAIAEFIVTADFCEQLEVCENTRVICPKISLDPTDGFNETLQEIIEALTTSLDGARTTNPDYDPADPDKTYQYELFQLFRCEPPPICKPGNFYVSGDPTPDDLDGDDVLNINDNCERVFNPTQVDSDSDGLGDECDPCPFDPDTTLCSPIDLNDIDNDGYNDMTDDNCPFKYNPDQTDSDSDGKGDSCDPCPLDPNPGEQLCTLTIYDIQNLLSPNHPPEGSTVRVEGAIVTAVRNRSRYGFWVEEPAGGKWSGIFVYLSGVTPTVTRGDIVNIEGEYHEYYEMSEIVSPTVTIVGHGVPPEPITVNPANIATGSPLAEGYEGVLVKIEDVVVIDENPDAPADYNEFMVTGNLRIDDYIYTISPDPVIGQHFTSITGVVHFTYENYKLLPRDSTDVITP